MSVRGPARSRSRSLLIVPMRQDRRPLGYRRAEPAGVIEVRV